MKINQYFIDNYLTCGMTYDNFIFAGCPTDLVYEANYLLKNTEDKISCNIMLTQETEHSLKKILSKCSNELQKKIIFQDVICIKIMCELLRNKSWKKFDKNGLQNDFLSILNGNWNAQLKFFESCPTPYDINYYYRNIAKFELNFLLIDIKDKYLQQAINNFISSRNPYSVKIFTNQDKLSTYYDQNGNLIECPHDYMTRDVNKYIDNNIEV